MESFNGMLLAVVGISALTFIALFGQLPALTKSPIGWMYRMLCIHVPGGMKAADRRISGGAVAARLSRLNEYLFYEKNPIVLIVFLFVLTGSSLLFLCHGPSLLPWHLLLPVPILLGLPYYFTYLCVTDRKHMIVPKNHEARIKDYPFDHLLYRPGVVCSTCNLIKPARSKHCSFCRGCVAKCDHHCPWINNCVGRGNHRYFLALLLSLTTLQAYGAYLSWYILKPYYNPLQGVSWLSAEYWDDLGWNFVELMDQGGLSIAGVGMLAAFTAPLPLALLLYHLYLIWAGMTTNESQKWADWRDDMSDGCVWKSDRETLKGRSGYDAPCKSGAEGDQVIIRTCDGQPPKGEEALWKQIWSLKDVDNLYDLGGWNNLLATLQGQ
ncbi:zf-DHHC-domain-containing protein [Piedraia hortae CBS 480.64]|uniref:Palmitoyltransferase n=1 Tax=Piedraia hortae CBS 480.64 TaxID=1314780 RepID=A0A6A7BQZ6_9PEZI|nr:zf-DHHC-domain-containing protein [Piedraia hortae CBS 480.64]